MKPDVRLDSACSSSPPPGPVAQDKSPSNMSDGRKEKIASGLLNPFLAHLKAVQDQIVKGGYSITLEPSSGVDAPQFTRGTMESLESGFLQCLVTLLVGSFVCYFSADLCAL